MFSNSIGNDGAAALGSALRVNEGLTSINLLRNAFDTAASRALAEIAKSKRLSLCGIRPAQTSAEYRDLKHPDAILIVSHLSAVSGALTLLNIDGVELPIKILLGIGASLSDPWGEINYVDKSGSLTYSCVGNGDFVIGRDRPQHGCNLPVQEELVSRTHCTLRMTSEGALLTDLSTHGTWVNGKKLGKDKTTYIQAGTLLTFSPPEARSEVRAHVRSVQPLVWRAYSRPIDQIDLSNRKFGIVAAIIVARGIKVNGVMSSLSINGNEIGPNGAIALRDALCVNRTLTSLDIGGCALGAEGAAAIAKSLKVEGAALAALDLSWNAIGSQGAAAIGDALCTNTALTSLNLFSNEIDDEGLAAIARGIAGNASLAEINLSDNLIGPKGGLSLQGSLLKNATLTSIDLRYKCASNRHAIILRLLFSLFADRCAFRRSSIGDKVEAALREVHGALGALTISLQD